MMNKRFLSVALLFFTFSFVAAQNDPILGKWYTENNSSIVLLKENNGVISGTIVWLKKTTDEDGQPKKDKKNPKKELRDRDILGLTILTGLEKDGNKWSGGEIYDPNSGNTYRCEAHLDGDALKVRGYMGISLIGRTTAWRKAEK